MSRPCFSAIAAALSCGLFMLSSAAVEAQQPSFDCAKASTAVEGAICGSTTLSALDVQISAAYSARRAELGTSGRGRLLADQRTWLERRDRCRADANCLAAAMKSRIAALSEPANTPAPAAVPYMGRWQPYGREAVFYSAMTLTSDRLAYDGGLTYDLQQVRPGSNVYRVRRVHGEGPDSNDGATHMAFIVHDGFLQLHMYNSRNDPADPPPMTPANMGHGQNGRFSVGFYTR